MAGIEVEPKQKQINYGVSGVGFSFVSSKQKERKQVSQIYTCRDFLNDDMIGTLNKATNGHFLEDLDFEKLRLLIFVGKATKDVVFKTKEILNMYENLGKIPRSVISSVDSTGWKFQTRPAGIYLLTGDKKWMHTSHLVSMITSLFRVCCCYLPEEELLEVASLEDAEKLFELYYPTVEISPYNVHIDKHIFTPAWPKFRMMMEKYDDLFGRFSKEELMPANKVKSWHSCGGIMSLTTFTTKVETLDGNMRKYWEEWKKEKKEILNGRE